MKDYQLFKTQHVNEIDPEVLAGEIIYKFLFQGTSVKRIETELFGEEEFRGFLSKTVLNYYGIDTGTESDNRGIYKGESLSEVARGLLQSPDCSRQAVGSVLWNYLKIRNQSSSRFSS